MSTPPIESLLEFLASFLEDEFKDNPEVRIRPRPRVGIRRAPDLVQDYNPDTGHLHRVRGIDVRVRGREYFFPAEWALGVGRHQVDELVAEIRTFLGP